MRTKNKNVTPAAKKSVSTSNRGARKKRLRFPISFSGDDSTVTIRVIKSLFYIILLICACILVYSNTLENGSHLDDFHVIVGNTAIRQVHPIWRHFVDASTMSALGSTVGYRPLLPLSLSITYAFFGYKAVGYHLFNIAFHILATVFLYLLFVRLLTFRKAGSDNPDSGLPAKNLAFLGALIFAIHPVSGVPVNYLSSRDNIMMLCFLIISLYSYLRMRRIGESPRRWATTVFFLLLALFSKPNALMFPALILTFELTVAGSKVKSGKMWLKVGIFGVIVLAQYAFRGYVLSHVNVSGAAISSTTANLGFLRIISTDIEGLMFQFKAHLFYYLRNFVWPYRLRGRPVIDPVASFLDFRMLLGFSVILSSSVFAWFSRKKTPVLSFCIFAYWIMFFVTKGTKYPADRWMYPSMPYISFIPAYLAYKYIPQRMILVISMTILVLYFGISSYAMNGVFRDDLSYWGQAAKYGTDAIGYNELAKAYIGVDDVKVEYYFTKSLEHTPNYYLGWINFGNWRIKQGDIESGLAFVEKGVDLTHRYAPTREARSRYLYSKALKDVNRPNEAYEEITKAIHLESNIEYIYEAAMQAQTDTIGRWEECLAYLELIHETLPNYKLSRFIAGLGYQNKGEIDMAIEEYKLAIEYSPNHAKSYFNMGYLLAKMQKYEEAIGYFEKYLEFAPDNEDAKGNILFCRNKLKDNTDG